MQETDNNDKEFIEKLDQFLHMADSLEGIWDDLYEKVGKFNRTQVDFLHDIEPDNSDPKKFDMHTAWMKLREIQELRYARRRAKNTKRVIEPLYNWVKNNKKSIIDLHKIRTEMDRLNNQNVNWTYNPRLDDDESDD